MTVVVVTQICTCDKMIRSYPYTPVLTPVVKFLVLILYYRSVRCNLWRELLKSAWDLSVLLVHFLVYF